jgi:hypothetical protein
MSLVPLWSVLRMIADKRNVRPSGDQTAPLSSNLSPVSASSLLSMSTNKVVRTIAWSGALNVRLSGNGPARLAWTLLGFAPGAALSSSLSDIDKTSRLLSGDQS